MEMNSLLQKEGFEDIAIGVGKGFFKKIIADPARETLRNIVDVELPRKKTETQEIEKLSPDVYKNILHIIDKKPKSINWSVMERRKATIPSLSIKSQLNINAAKTADIMNIFQTVTAEPELIKLINSIVVDIQNLYIPTEQFSNSYNKTYLNIINTKSGVRDSGDIARYRDINITKILLFYSLAELNKLV